MIQLGMKQLDNIHYDYRAIDGYNKPFNFIFGVREIGKTTMYLMKKFYFKWKIDKRPIIYLVRKSVEITEALITSIFDNNFNKFTDDNIKPKYTKGAFKDGITDIYVDNQIFMRIISLSIDLRRIKLAILPRISSIVFDEYIIDPRTQEKYVVNEAFKLKEAYTTWRRESEGMLKMYILANPYSLFNPLFLDWKVDLSKLKLGEFYVGDIFVIHWCKLSDELYQKLKNENPLYKEGSEYSLYALQGYARNDTNIPLGKLPQNFSLKYIFKIQGYLLGIFKNNGYSEECDYFIQEVQNIGKNRLVFIFDFEEMNSRTIILSLDERMRMDRLKTAIRMNQVLFNSVNDYYMMMEVYKNI